MKPCRECQHVISEQAFACPQCGAPYPAKEMWDGWGFEYKTDSQLFGLPLLHISFKFSPARRPVPAIGVFAIGQLACGIVTLAQFSLGVVSVSQFAISWYALAQFAIAYSLKAQIGLYLNEGHGLLVKSVGEVLGMVLK